MIKWEMERPSSNQGYKGYLYGVCLFRITQRTYDYYVKLVLYIFHESQAKPFIWQHWEELGEFNSFSEAKTAAMSCLPPLMQLAALKDEES